MSTETPADTPATDSTSPPNREATEDAPAATALPLARSSSAQPTTLIVISDDHQQIDHSHRPVPPVTAGGMPYRYKVRLTAANAYASTADEVLALFIDDYLPRPGPDRDTELEQIRRRGEHCLGVIVTHVAHAMLGHQLTADENAMLQRSAEFGAGGDPITKDECPHWSHPAVPLVLMGDLYAPEYGRFEPPAGNVFLIWPGRAERYLAGLAALGLVTLAENPAVTSTRLVELLGLGDNAANADRGEDNDRTHQDVPERGDG